MAENPVNTNRHYQGFSYPTTAPATAGGFPQYPFASSAGMVRRTTTAASVPVAGSTTSTPLGPIGGGGGVGYGNYFHCATSSAGGHSGLAVSDTGSSQSIPFFAVKPGGGGGGSSVPRAHESATTYLYPNVPGSAPHSAVQVRVDSSPAVTTTKGEGAGGGGGGSNTPNAVADPVSPTSVYPVEMGKGGGQGSTPPRVQQQRSPAPAGQSPRPPNSTTAISFLSSDFEQRPGVALRPAPGTSNNTNGTTTTTTGQQRAPVHAGSSGGPYRPSGGPFSLALQQPTYAPYTPAPNLGGRSDVFGTDGGGSYGNSNINVNSHHQHQQGYDGGSSSGGAAASPMAGAAAAAAGSGGKGFLKDMMNRLLTDAADDGIGSGGGVASGPRADEPRPLHQTRFGRPEDDAPLLEELGVYPAHIWKKACAVLNPFRPMPLESVEDTDLAGPVVFAVALAFLLSLQGKIQFSAIYGLNVLGIGFFKGLLVLMHNSSSSSSSSSSNTVSASTSSSGVADTGAPLQFIISSLGYALLPSLVLAGLRTLQFWLAGGYSRALLPLAFLVVIWSSWCATSLVARGLHMEAQRYLILYPMLLFYSLFATLTIF